MSHLQSLGYSRLHIFRKSWTAKQLRLRIYEIVRPLMYSMPDIGRTRKNIGNAERLQLEYKKIFLDSNGEYDFDNSLYDLEIHNNLPYDQGLMFNRITQCDFCGMEHKDNCQFAFQDTVTLDSILSLMKYDRELELTINWKAGARVNLKQFENPQFHKINLNAPTASGGKKQ